MVADTGSPAGAFGHAPRAVPREGVRGRVAEAVGAARLLGDAEGEADVDGDAEGDFDDEGDDDGDGDVVGVGATSDTALRRQFLLLSPSQESCCARAPLRSRHLPLLALTRWYASRTSVVFQTCELPSSQACCCTAVPSDVDAPFTSTHRPPDADFTPNPSPDSVSCHVWPAVPSHAAPPSRAPLDGSVRHVPSPAFTSWYIPASGPDAEADMSTPPTIAPQVRTAASALISTFLRRFD
ncbi:hypothetical protein GCM10010307_25130 [Streptomyces vastus]|uniref:Uncharacterized protein n=1 Tax=Streptomyces vastus TaxID=285451 RepID=A0ABP6D048_9ACTN